MLESILENLRSNAKISLIWLGITFLFALISWFVHRHKEERRKKYRCTLCGSTKVHRSYWFVPNSWNPETRMALADVYVHCRECHRRYMHNEHPVSLSRLRWFGIAFFKPWQGIWRIDRKQF